MKNLKIWRSCVLVCTIIFSFSCNKFDQEFDTNPINELIIETEAASYSVRQLERLQIRPNIKESLPTGEEFTYQWDMYTGAGTPAVVSTEKDLDILLTRNPGNYTLRLVVQSVTTGIAFTRTWPVSIVGAFTPGWFVASNKADVGQVTLIRTSDDELLVNPMDAVNTTQYEGKALGVYPTASIYGTFVYYFTDKGKYRFSANSLLEHSRDAAFVEGPAFTASATWAPDYRGRYQYIIADGGLHSGVGNVAGASTSRAFTERIPGDYDFFPEAFGVTDLFSFFYDNKHKRFNRLQGNTDLSVASSTTGSFNMAEVGLTMIASTIGRSLATTPAAREYFFLMESSSGTRSLMSLEGAMPARNVILSGPEVEHAKFIAAPTTVFLLYYATSNSIYVYDLVAGTYKKLYSFPADYVIKDFKIQRSDSKILAVGVSKGSEGEVYFFELQNNGELVGDSWTKQYTGFGEIVNIAQRP